MPAAMLARLVLLEARRGGLPWLALGCLALGMALAAFLSQVAVTESLPLQAALVAAVLRAGAVFLIAAQVAGSTLREMNDKVLELTLALHYVYDFGPHPEGPDRLLWDVGHQCYPHKMLTGRLAGFDVKQHWHRRFHHDSRSKWLRRQVAELFNDATDEWRVG